MVLQIALPPTAPAQVGHAPKTSRGPRALGLLELAPDGKARLIPIAILIDGKYYDASAYKADPVPMALWSDTVYEGVRTGTSLGLFTITGASQRKDADNETEWIAEGTWQTASSLKAQAAKKPVPSIPRGMNEDEGPPVLRRASTEKPKPPEPPPAPPSQPTPPAASGTPPVAPPAAPTATSSSPPTPPQPQQSQDATPPGDKDHPVLKRGEAGAVSAEEAQKKVSISSPAKAAARISKNPPAKANATSASSSGPDAAKQIQLIPAISDAHGPDPLPYNYKMTPQEEQQFRKKMLAMAADEIRARAAQLAPDTAAAKPVHAAPRGKTAAKTVQPTFEDVQLEVFDLADINEPELVLTARAHMPQSPHGKGSAIPNLDYMITLVVREDVNGDLHKSLANVTDNQHLDVIPRLDLIDAVDIDGDGRGELLFREVSDTSSAFVVYRVIGDELYPLFQGSLGE
ncbi:MAG: hypothetical protein WB711_13335 [Terriglobales bacterium]